MKVFVLFSCLALAFVSVAQDRQDDRSTKKHEKGAAAEIGGGAGAIGSGAAKGAGSAAVGVAKGAGDLATLHPIDAAAAVGGGAAKAGKDVTVGSAKGVGKIGKGVGHALRRIF
jgi:hypothetical protein